jgi:MerR family copper efflux transcriptional regulator
MEAMNIGQAAAASGVSAKMIRHYEQVGLFPQPSRTDGGYRRYTGRDVHTLRFIRHARDLGFSIAQIGELVGLWNDRRRSSRQVKKLAEAHIAELQRKAQELLAMKATLEHLVRCCHGDDRPDCPILDQLAAPGGAAPSSAMNLPRSRRTTGLRPGVATKGPRASTR